MTSGEIVVRVAIVAAFVILARLPAWVRRRPSGKSRDTDLDLRVVAKAGCRAV